MGMGQQETDPAVKFVLNVAHVKKTLAPKERALPVWHASAYSIAVATMNRTKVRPSIYAITFGLTLRIAYAVNMHRTREQLLASLAISPRT
jgi:hypothetical protein